MSTVALIAVFGATGTGKTTFVNDASGGDLRIGHSSHACTKDVEQSPVFRLDGREVVLFDTPGFDNTHLSDTEILKRISGFLAVSYQEGSKLTGIIYMHRITDIRMGGISRRTFNVFRKLCGKDSLSNVFLVTNMWSGPPTSQQVDRETELRTHMDFFQPAIAEGATMVRRAHKNRRSAHDIIRMLLRKDPVAMKVQQELVDEGKTLSDTGAGREVEHELLMAAEKHKADMEGLKTEMEEALRDRDERTQRELAQYQKEAKEAEEKRQAELAALRKGYDEEQVRWQQRAEKADAEYREMVARQQALQDELSETRRRYNCEQDRREQARATQPATEPLDELAQNEPAEYQYQEGVRAAEDRFLAELATLGKEYDDARWQRQAEQIRAELKAMEECQQAVRRDLEAAMKRQEDSDKQFRELRKRLADLGI